MTCTCSRLRDILQRRQGRKEQLKTDLAAALSRQERAASDLMEWEKVQAILRTVAKVTQQELEWHITRIVTFALEDVFSEPYELKIEFCERRNKTEADIYFVRKGSDERFDPLSSAGGGAVDLASLALRISLWNLTHPRKRAVIILDEPLKYLSKGMQPRTRRMLEQISGRLRLQIIMVTHETAILGEGDSLRVEFEDGLSKVVRDGSEE